MDPSVLKTSKDPQVLLRAALDCAAGPNPDDLKALGEALSSPAFLTRLDSKDEYLGPTQKLRLARVLDALMDNPAGHDVLVGLTVKPAFTALEQRRDLLIRALAAVRPAPDAAIRFWERNSTPGAPYLQVTIDALADNLSEPALALLEKKFADPRFEEEDKIAWMRDPVLRHRADVRMLRTCERMLAGSLPPALRPELVEALCDYKREWYLSEKPPLPPPPDAYAPEARAELRKICELALHEVKLTDSQKAAVLKTQTQMGM